MHQHTNNIIFRLTVHGQRVSQSAIQTLSSSLERVFHPDNFQ